MANTDPRYYDVATKTARLVFFATPHRSLENLSWEELVLRMAKATKNSYHSRRLPQILLRLAGFLVQTSHIFYQFASEYPMSNFVGEEKAREKLNTTFIFDADFEQVVRWADGGQDDGLALCGPDDLDKARLLRQHFAPRRMFSRRHKGMSIPKL